ANGNLQISPAKQLDGRLNVTIKKSADIVTIPLNVTGTLDDPTILPNKSALAGAAIGTAIAGPLGTGIGVKAGSAISNLFGGKK
ncbi:MAG TPA: AsmA family protein, partial [Methylophilaceae bacterium]